MASWPLVWVGSGTTRVQDGRVTEFTSARSGIGEPQALSRCTADRSPNQRQTGFVIDGREIVACERRRIAPYQPALRFGRTNATTLVRALPSVVRRISSRSNSAKPPRTVSISLLAVVVSAQLSCSDLKAAPRSSAADLLGIEWRSQHRAARRLATKLWPVLTLAYP